MNTDQQTNYYVAINLGSYYITGMLATKSSDGVISPIAMERSDATKAIRHGCIHNAVEASNAIGSVIDRLSERIPQFKITKVYVGVECMSMRSREYVANLTLGSEDTEVEREHLQRLREQAQSARYPDMEVLREGLSDARYLIDGKREATPRGVRGKSLEGRFQRVIVRSKYMDAVRDVFNHKLSLGIADILVTPVAEAAVTLSGEEGLLGCAYINMGAGTTSLSLYEERKLQAMHIIPLGGINITRDLTDLGILEESAEQVKREATLNPKRRTPEHIHVLASTSSQERTLPSAEVDRYVSSRIAELWLSVLNILKESNTSDRDPRSLVISGGVAQTDYFLEMIRAYGINVRIGSVRRNVVSEAVSERDRQLYQSVLGLIYQATENCVEAEVTSLSNLFEAEHQTDSSSDYRPDSFDEDETSSTIPEEELGWEDLDDAEEQAENHEPEVAGKRGNLFESLRKGFFGLYDRASNFLNSQQVGED